jgi:site-specific DNA-methyltransferase (adenine-specific)
MDIINKIICADVIEALKQVPENTVALTVTSPPYNVNIDYQNRDDNQPYREYISWLKNIFIEVYRSTKIGGRCCINIDAMTNRQDDKDQEKVRCIYAHIYNFMTEIGWLFRDEICWYKQNGVGKATAWGSYLCCSDPKIIRNHEYVLVFSKGQWRLDGDPELSDMTKEEWSKYIYSTWFITPETTKRGNHPAPFCEELVRRLVKLFSYRNDVVLDIFNGSGTSTMVAASLHRQYIGIDNVREYCDYAERRTQQAFSEALQQEMLEPFVSRSQQIKQEKSLLDKDVNIL